MGFHVNAEQFDTWLTKQQKTHEVYAPKCFPGGNTFSNVDCIRYGKVSSISEIVFDKKSEYSFKEVLTAISQTLFFFTEDQCKEADPPKKGAIIFLRSCDLHALKRLDDLYLHNGPADYYYKRIRDYIKIVLIGCKQSFESCFCVSMGTNLSENYDMSINIGDGVFELNCKDAQWNQFFMKDGMDLRQIEESVKEQIKAKLRRFGHGNESDREDYKWYYLVPMILDPQGYVDAYQI